MSSVLSVPTALGLSALLLTVGVAYAAPNYAELDLNLTDDQIEALEAALELRADGATRNEIKAYLEVEGIDQETRQDIRAAVREKRAATRAAVQAAVADENYDQFLAVAPEKLTEHVTSAADFARLVEASDLRENGDREGAREIMSELGFEKRDAGERGQRDRGAGPRGSTVE